MLQSKDLTPIRVQRPSRRRVHTERHNYAREPGNMVRWYSSEDWHYGILLVANSSTSHSGDKLMEVVALPPILPCRSRRRNQMTKSKIKVQSAPVVLVGSCVTKMINVRKDSLGRFLAGL